MKGPANLGVSLWFWTQDPWIGNPAPYPLGKCFNIPFYDLCVFREIFDQYGLKQKSYEELLLLNVSIYLEHENFLATEIYKIFQ